MKVTARNSITPEAKLCLFFKVMANMTVSSTYTHLDEQTYAWTQATLYPHSLEMGEAKI